MKLNAIRKQLKIEIFYFCLYFEIVYFCFKMNLLKNFKIFLVYFILFYVYLALASLQIATLAVRAKG